MRFGDTGTNNTGFWGLIFVFTQPLIFDKINMGIMRSFSNRESGYVILAEVRLYGQFSV